MPHEVGGEVYFVKQKVDYLEAIASTATGGGCLEQANTYSILDAKGETAYTAFERSSCCCRCCCAPYHKFQLDIVEGKSDGKDKPAVLTMYHPFKCPACCPICIDYCRGEIIVYDGAVNAYEEDEEGEVLSTIKQPTCGGYLRPTLQAFDGAYSDDKEPAYTIKGPFCCIGGLCGECCCPPTFNILQAKGEDEKVLAEIKKDKPEGVGGAMKEAFSDADNFTINMPPGATSNVKSAIIASSLLIDYLFFESDGNIYCDLFAQNGPELKCVCCNLYCCGAIVPCYCALKANKSDD